VVVGDWTLCETSAGPFQPEVVGDWRPAVGPGLAEVAEVGDSTVPAAGEVAVGGDLAVPEGVVGDDEAEGLLPLP
jgi:hypothetical protein